MNNHRVVHIMRSDPEAHMGGDLRQLHSTVAALRDEGVDAVAASWENAPAHADVVHLYNLWLPILLYRSFVRSKSRWPGAKIVVSPIFWSWPFSRVLRANDRRLTRHVIRSGTKAWATWPLCRHVLKNADAVLPLSRSESAILARYFRVRPGQSWHVVQNGIWLDAWPVKRRLDRTEGLESVGLPTTSSSVVACVGGIQPRKNQRNLVRAVSRIDGAGLLLMGPLSEQTYANQVFELADRLMPGRWKWLGQVPNEKLGEVLSVVDVSVLPSYREPVGLVSLEAAAAGCEVVVSRCSGAVEYLGDSAYVCEPERIASIEAAIREAIAHPRQPAARRRVENYDWSAAGRMIAEVYRQIE